MTQVELPPHPIFVAAQSQKFEIVSWFLEKDPTLVKGTGFGNNNLLHFITNELLFKKILQIAPELLHSPNSYGECPIHSLFYASFSTSFIKWILEQDPSLLYVKDEVGHLPIHLMAYNLREDLVDWILLKDPSLIYAKDNRQMSVLHSAANRASILFFNKLMEYAPELLFHKDHDGYLPIHYLRLEPLNNPIIISLFEKYPQLLEEKNPEGFLPIHLACQEGNKELVEWLVDHAPSFTGKSLN